MKPLRITKEQHEKHLEQFAKMQEIRDKFYKSIKDWKFTETENGHSVEIPDLDLSFLEEEQNDR